MSPRVIHLPLSGGDRKHYARELRHAQTHHERLLQRIEEAREITIRHRRETRRLMCEEWSVRQFLGGPADPSPTIAAAIDAGCIILSCECRACARTNRFDLKDVVWPRNEQVHTLAGPLRCQFCHVGKLNLMSVYAPETDTPFPQAARAR